MDWINVNERLPENEQHVIIWDGEYWFECRYSDGEFLRRGIDGEFYLETSSTHWFEPQEPI